LGQQAQCLLQFVLDLNLGNIRVGPGLESQGDGDAAGGGTLRVHVEQIIQTIHVLLDDLGDAILDSFGGRPRIFRGNLHRGWCDLGVLGDRQAHDRKRPGQHDDNSNDPGKDGTIDKKTGHGLLRFRRRLGGGR